MTVLKKAVLINYDRLNQMIESNEVNGETVYFLSGKDIINAVKNIQVPSIEGLAKTSDIEAAYAKKTELQHLTAGEGITISETGVISLSAPQVDLSDYVKDESLSLDGLNLVAKYEAAKIKYDNPLATTETAENH
nr:MAG TPA: hypothetical protein [Caudoviricetes sp.]